MNTLDTLIDALEAKGVRLALDGAGGLRIRGDKSALSAELMEALRRHKAQLLEWLAAGDAREAEIQPVPREGELPASYAQQRLWFIDRFGGGSAQYNMPGALRIEGRFDADLAERALARIVQRHEPLRTVFVAAAAGPLQQIRRDVAFSLSRQDFSALPPERREQAVREALNADAVHPFALDRDLMLRASYLCLGESEGVLLFNMHHIASDGWSMGVLVREFVALYDAFSRGEADPLPPLPVQYADYAAWQQRWLSGERLERQLSYWQRTLAGVPQTHELPLDYPRPSQQTFAGAAEEVRIAKDVAERLRTLAKAGESTLFMLLHAALAALLARHGGSEDVVLGTPVANRRRAELEPLVGFFVNTLVLRTNSPLSLSFRDHLAAVRQVNLDAQAHQDVPFEHVVERLQPHRSASHTPLFQILFAMDTSEAGAGAVLPSLRLTPLFGDEVSAKFDLTFNATDSADGIGFGVAYNRDLFHRSTIVRLCAQLRLLLERIADNPDSTLAQLTASSEQERQHLLYALNATAVDYPLQRCLHHFVEEQAQRSPEAPALSFEDTTLSYAELNARSNRLAHYLRELGVGPDIRVGLCTERSIEMVVAILAVLKAGGGYVPLDPEYPAERLDYMLSDSAPAVVLLQQALRERLPESSVPMLCLDADAWRWSERPATNPVVGVNARHLAYVIYTSGSTGRPKGVMNEHAGVINRLLWSRDLFDFGSDERVLQKTPYSFDVSVGEIFLALMCGAELVMARPGGHRDPHYLARVIEQRRITGTAFVPSMMQAFLEHAPTSGCGSLRRIWCSGEALPYATVRRFQELLPGVVLHNLYGPTEAAIDALSWDCGHDLGRGIVPIGRPIANMSVYILDAQLQPVPQGVCGEIWLGGVGVARGYHNRPELTAERFLPDPFASRPGMRMYRTGDLGRWLPENVVEYLGRNDFQVKIRGLRIELGEIEQQLLCVAGVNSAVVVAREDQPGDKYLVAYVAADDDESLIPRLRRELRARLPEYMLPSAFVRLSQLPQLNNGKIDRKALPAPSFEGAAYVAPSTPTQIALARVWAALLGREAASIGVNDGFFALGGHSLLSIRLVTEIRERFGVELEIRAVFDAERLGDLASVIDRHEAAPRRPAVVPLQRESDLAPVSFAQRRLWLIDRFAGGSAHYNMPGALRVSGTFDPDLAEQALQRIIARHEPLRTVYVETDQGPLQRIRAQAQWQLQRVDLRALPPLQHEAAVQAFLAADAAAAFDLSRDVMLRAAFLRLSETDGVFAFNMHHIASDGWSMGLLVREFLALYAALAQGGADPLPALPVSYADYAAWQQDWLSGEVLERQLGYWERQLAALPAVHALPLDRPRPAQQSYNGALHRFALDAATLAALKQRALAGNATLFMLLHAAFALVLARISGETDIVIGTPVANRLQKELEPLVGFFVNTLVLRADCAPAQSFDELLAQVRRTGLDAQTHQDLPFEYLVERLQPVRDPAHTPLFQIVLSLTEPVAAAAAADGLRFDAVDNAAPAAKFDISLDAAENADGLAFSLLYNRDLFDATTMQRLGGCLSQLLRAIAAGALQPIGLLPLLQESDRRQLLSALAGDSTDWDIAQGLHQRFEAQVRRHPDKPAVIDAAVSLSFAALDTDANRLARALRAQGVGEGSLVGIALPRTADLVLAILAVLKAGAAYVPIDPAYPLARRRYLVQDCGATLLLAPESAAADYAPLQVLDPSLIDLSHFDASVLPDANAGERLAYVLYTSGSTGEPKGAAIEHRAVMNLALNLAEVTRNTDGAWGWIASAAFDASVQGLAELANGRTLVVIDESTKRDGAALAQLIGHHRIGVLDATPSLVELWLSQQIEAVLPLLVIGGEAIAPSLWQRLVTWRGRYGRRAVNVYGPTECCVDSTLAEIEGPSPHIGRPLHNVRTYVLDAAQQLVPFGGRGELYIGGVGVGRGYHGRAELTAQRFVTHREIEGRLYRSGDLVRYRQDGNLDYLGRNDEQIKLRGYRIEPGEIEQQLRRLPGVRAAAVVVREDVPGDPRLVAYVAGITETAELAAQLRGQLPDHLMPSAFVGIAQLPLTTNGKLDRIALPPPVYAAEECVAAADEAEQQMVALWAELLQRDTASVSATANFFALGGHSLLAARLITRLRESAGLELALRDLFDYPVLRDFTAHAQRAARAAVPAIVAADRSTPLPLSFAQRRLWFIDQIDGDSRHYHLSAALRLEGELDRPALQQAIDTLIERHEVLRTTFEAGEDGPVQRVHAAQHLPLAQIELSAVTEAMRESEIARLAEEDVRRPFDLSADALLRVTLLVLGERSHVVLFTQHHIASDGWSIGVLVREFSALYAAAREGRANPLPALAIQYADFAHWQRQWLSGEVLDAQLGYWRQQLAGIPAVHGLPLDRVRPPRQGYAGRAYWHELDADLWRSVRTLARRENVTDFMVLQTVFALLVARYSHECDVVIGTPVAGRSDSRLEPLIGFFINNLVLRSRFETGMRFRDALAQQRRTILDAYAHQHVPFEMLVEALNPERSLAYDPVFQIVFSLNNNVDEQLSLPGLVVSALRQPVIAAKVDLEVVAIEDGDHLTIGWTYRSDLFDAASVAGFAAAYERLLRGIVADAESRIFDYPLLQASAHTQQLAAGEGAAAAYERTAAHALIQAQARRSPNAVAVVCDDVALSYAELDTRANRLAQYLLEAGVEIGSRVGLHLERSAELVIALLAVLKAGGCYVPLEPNLPRERLAAMAADAQIGWVLLSDEGLQRLPLSGVDVFSMDGAATDADWLAEYDGTSAPDVVVGADDLAYVLYTSGSTGTPKGVMVPHGALANYLDYAAKNYLEPAMIGSVVSSPLGFDATLTTLLPPLLLGKQVELLPDGEALLEILSARLYDETPRLFKITPAHLEALGYLADGRTGNAAHRIVVGGEQLGVATMQTWKGERLPQARFVNEYGPTETVVGCSVYELATQEQLQSLADRAAVPIGRPIQNTQLYVLGEGLQLQPDGSLGELYIGGDGVTRGYLHRDELTAERFIANPFGAGKLYRTGDLVRWLPEGELAFEGRRDEQVKIRGFRIELGEIEAVLRNVDGVRDAVAVVRKDGALGDARIVAYLVVPSASEDLAQRCREQLAQRLPDYMWPAAFVSLDALPLTPNGKVDRQRLPAPTESRVSTYRAPRSDIERTLCEVWQQVLAVETVGIGDNFFSLGGDSILSIRIVALLRRQGLILGIRDIFEHQTIEQLAASLSTRADQAVLMDEEKLDGVMLGERDELGEDDIEAVV